VSLAVIAADLATKAWVSAAFRLGESLVVTPFFNLVLLHNTGAAFSFLAGAGGWQRWLFIGLAVGISAVLLWMLRREHGNALAAWALALLLGGAAGNLWDRVRLGYVVDFIQLHAGGYYWPAFNVADSAITVGVAMLIWDSFRDSRAGRPAAGTGRGRA
jgi:signal peptidase II